MLRKSKPGVDKQSIFASSFSTVDNKSINNVEKDAKIFVHPID